MKTFLAMGQSNCIGRGDGGEFPASALVTVWNNLNDIETLSSVGNAFVPADRTQRPFVGSCNNMMYHAARYFADLAQEDVRLIIVAEGGIPISKWTSGSKPMYARMQAVLAAAGVTSVDALLWHQGETDNQASAGYAASFGQLLTNLEIDGYITSSTPVVIGEVASKCTGINPVLRSLEGGRVKCANTSLFLLNSDDTHFTGPALVRCGWQYAKCLHDLILTPWSYSMGEYVSCKGNAAISFPSGSARKVPVASVDGDSSWIDASGSFVAPFAGVFKISGTVYTGAAKTFALLLDASGGIVERLAYASDAVNGCVSGVATLDLAEGDVISLGGQQSSGSSVSLSAGNSSTYNKLLVEVLENYSAA